MPRRNENHVYDRSRRPKRRGRASKPAPVDWERVEAERNGYSSERQPEIRRREPRPNEFQRHITGFSEHALELLERYELEGAAGFIAVRFTGVSDAPRRQIEYRKPTIVVSKAGTVVLSGMVDGTNLDEIGGGYGPIRQVDVPDLDSHDAPRRLNVSLGREPQSFDSGELAKVLVDEGSTLMLSKIAIINGQAVTPHGPSAESMWNGVVQQRSRYGW